MSKTTYTLSFTPEVEKLASRIGGIEALTREVREELDHQFCYLGEECAFPDLGLISGRPYSICRSHLKEKYA
jgi:hypothetical protein